MKKIICFALCAVMMMGVLAACQKTPESPIVVGKDQDELLDKAQQNTPDESEPDTPLAERLGIPEVYGAELETRNEKLIIRIDGEIQAPAVSQIPIVRTQAADFSQEIVSLIFDRLCAGRNMTEVPQQPTKGEIEKEIINYRRGLGDPEYADSPDVLRFYEEEIARLEKLHPTAPETNEAIPCTGMLHEIQQTNHQYHITLTYNGLNAYEEQTQAVFWVQNNNDLQQGVFHERRDENGNVIGGGGMNVRRNAYMNFMTEAAYKNFTQHPLQGVMDETITPQEAQGKLMMTPAEARAVAESLLAGTGMVVRGIYLTDDANMGQFDNRVSPAEEYAYKLYCVREVQGVPQSVLRGESASPTEGFALAPSWSYEMLQILIGDGGVISFDWTSPHSVGETVIESPALLAFSEIMSIGEKMLPITQISARDMEFYERVEITVDHIALEYQRITEQNSIENGLLIPVWSFYGTQLNTDTKGETFFEHNGVFDPLLLLTINAIDGSVIDWALGY